jgi:hypothetical protein
MSAVIHKRTSEDVRAMSALPPESGHVQRKQRCPLRANSGQHCPLMTLPTAIGQSVMSRDALNVLGQKIAWRQITDIA